MNRPLQKRTGLRAFHRAALGCLIALSFLSTLRCDNALYPPTPRMKGPMDLAVAGLKTERGYSPYMFVAAGKKNAVYVFDMTEMAFIRGPNRFFPLEIVFKKRAEESALNCLPTGLSVRTDQQLIAVLCTGTQSVWLVDAVTLKVVRRANGDAVTADVGVGPSQIVHVRGNEGVQAERFYVTHASDTHISVLELDASGRDFVVKPDIRNVGAVSRAVVSADQRSLWALDAQQPLAHQIELATAQKRDFDIGSIATDIAVSTNGSSIYIVKPEKSAIDVYQTATGAQLNTDPQFAPFALKDGEAYKSILLPTTPSQIRLFHFDEERAELGGDGAPLSLSCQDAVDPAVVTERRLFDFALVMGYGGAIYIIDTERNELLNANFCNTAQALPKLASDTTLFKTIQPFVACDPRTLPRRMSCDPASGVIAYPYRTFSNARYLLTYEETLPGSVHTDSGSFVDESTFTDATADFEGFGFSMPSDLFVQAGDRLMITTLPIATSAECIEKYGNSVEDPKREFEITAVIKNGAAAQPALGAQLKLGTPIQTSCFAKNSQGKWEINYRIRAGKSLIMKSVDDVNQTYIYEARLRAAQTYGANNDKNIRFTVKPTLNEWSRDQAIDFIVNMPFFPIQSGFIADYNTQTSQPAGRLPTTALIADAGTAEAKTRGWRAFVAFAGTDSIVTFRPFSPSLMGPDYVQIFR